MAKSGSRNQPCPCGSEKKFKRCCGDNATIIAANRAAWAEAMAKPLDPSFNPRMEPKPMPVRRRMPTYTAAILMAALAVGIPPSSRR